MKVMCPNCGRTAAASRELSKYHYKESGLNNVWLSGGVTETKCAECGETFIRIWKEPQLLQLIAMDLLMEPSLAPPAMILRSLSPTADLRRLGLMAGLANAMPRRF